VDEPEREAERCCFDDWVDNWDRQAARKDTVAGVTGSLLEALAEAGLSGRSVLDVGCGIGDLALTALTRGATSAYGVDLSPKAIEHARELASARGLGDRARFEIGDGSLIDLPPADVVVVNRVVCCYPDADGLLDHSLAAAGSVYAFTAPVSGGVVGLFSRAFNAFGNLSYRLRKRRYRGFRTFIHDVERIDARVRSAGFRPLRRERRRLVWELAVYTR
jgi:SAM-dependent methyltransferase